MSTAETLITKLRTLFIEEDGLSESWADTICDSYLGAVKLSKGIGLENELLVAIENYEPPATISGLRVTTHPAAPASKLAANTPYQAPKPQTPAQQKKPQAPVHHAPEDNYRCAICGYRASTISADQKCPICKAQRWESTKQSSQPAAPSNQSDPQIPSPQKKGTHEVTPKILRKMEAAELLLAGNSCLKKEEYDEAADYYRVAAGRGSAIAQYELGRLYHLGLGVRKDAELADEALCASANSGYIPACVLLGQIRFGAKKYASAWKWFYKAVEKNDPTALYYAFVFYKNGHHVTRSEKNARRYLEMALQQNSPEAHLYVAKEAHTEDDFSTALPHFQSAADRDFAEAQYCLGKYYSAGNAIKADIFAAAYWFKKAADQGHTKVFLRKLCKVYVCYTEDPVEFCAEPVIVFV